ncbi:MAG TPA: class I SAM-dependent methyltransferase [Longimicrobium sp.]|nr:class I SAM-dependent methyltransferase [Longimicrobium sp.]
MDAAPKPVRAGRAPLRVRAFLGVSAAWKNAGALLQATYDGVWLGLLRRADLHAVDERYYDRTASYHGDAHNLRGLFDWEKSALEAFAGCRRVAVLGAGGGREVLALSRMGFDVTGYECNAALVRAAGEFLPRQGCAARVVHLPRDEVPSDAEPFDGIILGWSAYTLISGRAHRIHLLRRLRPLVRPGGPLLLSFWTRGGDTARFRVSAAVANAVRAVTRGERIERGDALAPNFAHFFVAAEVSAELREAGWTPRRFTPHGSGGRDSGWAIGTAPDADAAEGIG